MSLFMNNRLIVSKQYQSTFWFSKYRIVSILFRFCRLLELIQTVLFAAIYNRRFEKLSSIIFCHI